jgi:nitrogen fixation NifU-like protein
MILMHGISDHLEEAVSAKLAPQFWSHAQHPHNTDSLINADGQGNAVGSCGDSLNVLIKIKDERIEAIRQTPNGCVYTVACGSAMSVLAKGRHLETALKIEPEDVEAVLGGLPDDHRHCARLAVNTLGEAIADYYHRRHNDQEAITSRSETGDPGEPSGYTIVK